MHALVAGWFSFKQMGTTAGDLLARDMVCEWLKDAGISYDVAVHEVYSHPAAIDWEKADPEQYSDIIFVCGPFGNGWPVTDFLEHFKGKRLTGINLSLMEPLEIWDPFTLLFERDSSRMSNPDITFYAPPPAIPVVGVILVHKQKEYGAKALHDKANAAIEQLTNSREMSVVMIDTVLENNKGGLRTPGEVEALIAKMDVVITTRLHGTVLALKNGIPVIPVDPIAGGAKITRQIHTFGWDVLFQADSLEDKLLAEAFEYCLTSKARMNARACAKRAIQQINRIKNEFITALVALQQTDLSNADLIREGRS